MNLAIIGATGNVGRKIIEVLEKSKLAIENLYLVASKKSAGQKMKFNSQEIVIQQLEEYDFSKAEITIFAAGSEIAKNWVPTASKKTIVIDNSKQFRMDDDVPLVVPEVNKEDVDWHQGIISIPNCTTTPLVMILHALKRFAQIQRINVSTYQAVSGAGAQAVQELMEQTEQIVNQEKITPFVFPEQIAMNVIPQVDEFENNGYTKEEMKIVNETRKILHLEDLAISATCTRVPTILGHCESVLVEFDQEVDLEKIIPIIADQEGITHRDLNNISEYPTPLNSTMDENVYVGRIRNDLSNSNSLLFWLVSDNLLKGAATNAVQIAESIIERKKLEY